MGFLTVVYGLIILVGITYLYIKWIYSHWNRRGLYSVNKEGNANDLYFQLKTKGLMHGGFYTLMQPTYLNRDLDVIQSILIKNFDHFVNRGIFYNEATDPLSISLVSVENDVWRKMRTKLSPTFTSGKMKMMFNLMNDCANTLKIILENHADSNTPVNVDDTICRFGIDVIGSCAFGIDCNASTDENSEFRWYTRHFNMRTLRRMIAFRIPRHILVFFRFKGRTQDVEDFYVNLVKKMIHYRDTNDIVRKDFLQLLMQLRDKGEVSEDDNAQNNFNKNKSTKQYMSLAEITAQCYTFFAAGFLTSSTAITFTLLELAQNQDIQDKLRKEIYECLENDGEFTYENITGMEYLGKVANESLRKHPPAKGTQRVCNKEFKVPGTDFVLKPGDRVNIPAFSIQHDPDIYPDPDKFDPERFSPENVAKRHPMTFMPFGDGPRICIGFRFALLEIRLAVARIIKDFRVTVNEKTILPVTYDSKALMLKVKGGTWLNFSRLEPGKPTQ